MHLMNTIEPCTVQAKHGGLLLMFHTNYAAQVFGRERHGKKQQLIPTWNPGVVDVCSCYCVSYDAG
jgi:hypothetical protein